MDFFHPLPTKVISNIFSNLSRADLRNTSYISHRLSAISQPLLYSAPALHTYKFNWVALPRSELQNFLLTILSPRGAALSTYVHSLTLNWNHDRWHDLEFDNPERFLTDTGSRESDPSSLALRGLTPDSQLLLLLTRLPNLQLLDVEFCSSSASFNSFIADLCGTLTNPRFQPSAFDTLRSFQYRTRISSFGMNQSSLLTLLLLPCIDTLTVTLAITDHFPATFGAGCTSTVTKLRLWNDGIRVAHLSCILRIPARLTSFACHTPMNAPFAGAMRPLRKSLTHLELVPRKEAHAVGSLRAWEGLPSLRCTLAHLVPTGPGQQRLADGLPRGIRTLELIHHYRNQEWEQDVARLVSEVVDLMQRKQEVVPVLRKLTVNLKPGKERDAILEACLAAGVAYVSEFYMLDGCCFDGRTCGVVGCKY